MIPALTASARAEIERDCTRLVLQFAEAVDGGRFQDLAQLFTADAVFYRPAEPDRPLGIGAVIDSYRHRLGSHVSVHLVTNILITAESPDSARGSARILFYAAPADAASEAGKGRRATLQLVGGFADRFVRTASGWRFAQRRGEMFFNA